MAETTTQAAGTEAAPAPVFPEGTKLREYETIYLLKPDLGDDAVERFKERIRGLVAGNGGKVIKFTIWGKKKTHFEMEKATRAIFTHVQYVGPNKLVAELERNLRISDEVVRYQTIKLADETDANKPVEQDVKMSGDADQLERPPREERREEFGGGGGAEADRSEEETTEESA